MTPISPRDTDRKPDDRRRDDAFGHALPLGRWFGIPVRAHWTVIITVLLFATLLATSDLPAAHAHRSTTVYWLVAVGTSAALIVTLLVHEIAHAVVARHFGIRVKTITLWMLGGFTELDGEAPTPRSEALIALAGPGASLAIGGVLFGGAWLMHAGVIAYAVLWLGVINGLLAVFNLIPGAPLDGGRVLRAFLWWRTKDPTRASEGAARTGQSIGIALIVLGGLELLAGSGAGLWLAFVGWFVYSGAGTERWAARARHLTGVRVRDVMQRDPMIVPQWWTVRSFLDHLTPDHAGQGLYPLVGFEGASAGAVTMADLHRAGLAASDRQVREFARRRVLTVAPDAQVADLLMPLRLAGGTAVVAEDGRPVGLLTESDLIQAMRLTELGWRQPATSAS